ncbi:sialidase family protein [Streptomyces sp. DSM 44917]|uniref:exo-alpha-sialidase n=1 Tax=Streptomyces boetiae TaxID=3075541 RepID=A0ABU2L4H3_9ACTN|nr:sialidase family protein [Streptomyces sp. DSM 44917]MDT0306417.1 sialidase family protein [Streptomyces sp. DSM 44917]
MPPSAAPEARTARRPTRILPRWSVALVTVLWAVLITAPAANAAGPQTFPAAPERELSQPFKNQHHGYTCFRIPAVVTAPDGTLLAFAEARRADCGDVGDIDLVLRRSTDGGRSWGELTVLRGAGDRGGFGNPVPVVDALSGRISVLYAHNSWLPEGDRRVRRTRTLHSLYSTDGGLTWRAGGVLGPLKPAHWTWVSVGPGHGVQLRRGPHAGRLVVPGDHDTAEGRSGAQLYYSDDGGATWRLGAVYETDSERPNPGELTLAELVDGSLYVNARSSAPGPGAHRLAASSRDGGESFTAEGFAPVPALETPPVSASLLRLSATDEGDPRNRLLLSAPSLSGADSSARRRTLTIRSSYDEGVTWQEARAVINPGRAGYSDLTLLPTGEIGLLYETGTNSPHGTVMFTAFSVASLDGGVRDAAQCAVPAPGTRPAGGTAWVPVDRGPPTVRAAATVNRRTPSSPPRPATPRRPAS